MIAKVRKIELKMKTTQDIHIDGSKGEGGGQVLRSALALSLATGKPFRMSNIRAGRKKPGLLRQHFTCVKAATALCDADVEGLALGSQELTFIPALLRAATITLPLARREVQSWCCKACCLRWSLGPTPLKSP